MKESRRDGRIGARVRRSREIAGRTQTEVAEEMRGVGFSWRQSTVWSVETGARPLRLSEAAELSDLVGFDLREIAYGVKPDDRAESVRLACAELSHLQRFIERRLANPVD